MNKILYAIGSSLLQKWLFPQNSFQTARGDTMQPKLNFGYLSGLASRYVKAIATAFVFTLFFVAGLTVTLVSIATSIDMSGSFIPSVVFYTGLGMALISLGAVAACVYAIRNTKITTDQFYLMEEVSEPTISSPVEMFGLVQPFLAGLVNGWKKERERKTYASSTFYSDDTLRRADETQAS